MNTMVKECGELLKRLENQKQAAQEKPEEEIQIYAAMIAEYQKVMLRLEQSFIGQDARKYLEIRRARHAVIQGHEKTVPTDILYSWMVENICDLEA
ncbi:hypothetical protein CE91St62_09620 [Lachnospiraceae bacterium]|uniref:hypothetical protein n=1 Tax=Extibacter sp. GGCC_0201 TaxID=2731209 RepID=UPI001AA1B6A2|nr:hypothetical protein [Extibacter sp. GGCC_0201]MBO1722728.1 hypothetical protein [Extibacter sp. GGCC_0201]BDF32896.1 hypothetical protein CE91St61_09710 [Lachnospiraceae bacterium]BDF36901.1 hypothetical protein CE91St62_09620 [Lachnospiraceae bacterium]